MFVRFTSLFHIWKICEIFRNFINCLENIANMHREHDVLDLFKHRPKHRGRCFVKKHRLKIASLRIGKHCIVKKTEHRPPLATLPRCSSGQAFNPNQPGWPKLHKTSYVHVCAKKFCLSPLFFVKQKVEQKVFIVVL